MNRTEFINCQKTFLDLKNGTTRKNYFSLLSMFFRFLEEHNIEEITPLTIEQFKIQKMRQNSQNTVHQYMKCLLTFFQWHARITGEPSPMTDSMLPEKKPVKYNLLTRKEIETLLHATPKGYKKPLRNKAIITLMLQSGLRNSELRALKISDLHFEKQNILVRNGKGGKSRYVPFPQLSQSAVKNYMNSECPKHLTASDLLFGTDTNSDFEKSETVWNALSSQTLNDIVKRWVKDVCGKEIHPHTLRHAAASLWDEIGVPIREVQKALGHASIATTENVYVSILNPEKAAEKICSAFEQNAG